MKALLNINYHYIACFSGVFLATKILLTRFILKRVTVPKTKVILVILVILFSPISFTVTWLFKSGIEGLFWASLCAYWLDLALVNWVRVIFEPLKTLDDIEYDPSLTN
jgi:hypothetical protein